MMCSVEGCNSKVRSRSLCSMHYTRMRRKGTVESNRRDKGTGTFSKKGYLTFRGRQMHVILIEKILGKKLPKDAEVHHINGNKADNRHENLVVCPDQVYHALLHMRQKALEECGNANYFKCWYCKKYDDPKNMYFPSNGKRQRNRGYHRECAVLTRNKANAASRPRAQ